ncbi:MAG: NlpC/P60 family protein [Pseudomonadota bacterium]
MADPTTTRRTAPALLLGLVAALTSLALLAAGAATADPSLADKRAQAQRVLAEVQGIDAQLGQAVEAYNAANIRLDQIEAQQRANRRLLGITSKNLGAARKALEARVVALYTSGGNDSAIEVLLGATSLEDFLNRMDAVDRVSAQDTRVLDQVKSFQTGVRKQKAQLAKARARQAAIVAEQASRKQAIQGRLAERQRLLSSIRGEIEQIMAAERRRALAAAAATRARMAANPQAYVNDDDASIAAAQSASTDGAPPAPPAKYGGVVGIAMQYLGVPYRWGGASPSGFDCSGLVMYVYAQVGVSLPHYTGSLWGMGVPVSREDLQPGDLVFFNGLGHMGIYAGGGSFVHAPHTGDVVKVSSLSDSWYAATYMGARRIL